MMGGESGSLDGARARGPSPETVEIPAEAGAVVGRAFAVEFVSIGLFATAVYFAQWAGWLRGPPSPGWLLAAFWGFSAGIAGLHAWVSCLGYPTVVLLRGEGVEVCYRRYSIQKGWDRWGSGRVEPFPFSGVALGFTDAPDDLPLPAAAQRRREAYYGGRSRCLMSRGQARAVLTDRRYRGGEVPPAIVSACRLPARAEPTSTDRGAED